MDPVIVFVPDGTAVAELVEGIETDPHIRVYVGPILALSIPLAAAESIGDALAEALADFQARPALWTPR